VERKYKRSQCFGYGKFGQMVRHGRDAAPPDIDAIAGSVSSSVADRQPPGCARRFRAWAIPARVHRQTADAKNAQKPYYSTLIPLVFNESRQL